jgi:hypothetical protein
VDVVRREDDRHVRLGALEPRPELLERERVGEPSTNAGSPCGAIAPKTTVTVGARARARDDSLRLGAVAVAAGLDLLLLEVLVDLEEVLDLVAELGGMSWTSRRASRRVLERDAEDLLVGPFSSAMWNTPTTRRGSGSPGTSARRRARARRAGRRPRRACPR